VEGAARAVLEELDDLGPEIREALAEAGERDAVGELVARPGHPFLAAPAARLALAAEAPGGVGEITQDHVRLRDDLLAMDQHRHLLERVEPREGLAAGALGEDIDMPPVVGDAGEREEQ